jgi:energy-coupling factor transporter ATP-binding protein EcfA2
MLLRFKVRNFKSLYREQEFSMVPVKSKTGEHALPVALIYGPNASGKSNLVAALNFIIREIRSPFRPDNVREVRALPKFKLAENAEQESSEFILDFEVDSVRYSYGVVSNGGMFVEEWLFAYYTKRPTRLFERRANQPIQFGEALKGQNRELEKLASPQRLFLSVAGLFEHGTLLPIWMFFTKIVFVGDNSTRPSQIATQLGRRPKMDLRIIEFLKNLKSGITTHRIEARSRPRASRNPFATAVPSTWRQGNLFEDQSKTDDEQMVEERWVELGHTSEMAKPVYFDPELESSGTGRLLLLLDRAFLSLDRGSLLIIDEIDLSLHSLACLAIVQLFNEPEINHSSAQLIATTHDTNLICSPQLSRDQIWFAEKDAQGATEIYPLSDFKVRENDNFERGYLRGRFGALPFAGDPAELFRSMRIDDEETV